ncbi:MAG TPA: ribosome biogenesis GTPase Der [Ignavibacteriaceae bacterium]|nr:ribosome biogenesis GTPase Der [Ignavibacteriaceae bacterium]
MKKPLVVIVGRPNVGKSTFFNRIVGQRDAIVDDLSGVTRDRNYSEAEWAGKEFRLIDTGGYVPDSPDLFEKAIRGQVEIAITEADKIIFMVDVRHGVNPMDEEIVKMLRTSGKEFMLTVNKVDSDNYEAAANEFYSLGVDEIFDVSALMGRKIGDFLDILTKNFPAKNEFEEKDHRLKIAVVGRPNVGKSSLTNALLGIDRSIVTDIPGTTRDSLDSVLKYYGEEILLIDTAGLRKKKKVEENIEFYSNIRSLKSIGECDVAVVMLDSKVGLEKQDQKIIDEAERRRKGIIIAVNKWDLVEKDTNTSNKMETEIRGKLGALDYLPVIFISALTKQRIFKLIELSKNINKERKKKISTNTLNETLLPEILKTPPPSTHTGKEIKIKFISQVGDNYPVFLFFSNYPKYIPDHYKRFLEKMIRKNFGFEGVPFTISFKEK